MLADGMAKAIRGMKQRIIYTKVYNVPDLWCGNGTYSAKITGNIYLNLPKFLWWELKPYLTIRIFTPYLKKPFYDGEHTTNKYLKQLELQMLSDLELQKDKIQRRLDKLYKK